MEPSLFLKYTDDLPQSLPESISYLFADDMFVFYQKKGNQKLENVLNKESSTLCKCFFSNLEGTPTGLSRLIKNKSFEQKSKKRKTEQNIIIIRSILLCF